MQQEGTWGTDLDIFAFATITRKEGHALFKDALNTFYLRLYGVRHMVKHHTDSGRGNMGYSFRITARVILYAPSHRQDCTYHGPCYTSCRALAGTRNSSMGNHYKDYNVRILYSMTSRRGTSFGFCVLVNFC